MAGLQRLEKELIRISQPRPHTACIHKKVVARLLRSAYSQHGAICTLPALACVTNTPF